MIEAKIDLLIAAIGTLTEEVLKLTTAICTPAVETVTPVFVVSEAPEAPTPDTKKLLPIQAIKVDLAEGCKAVCLELIKLDKAEFKLILATFGVPNFSSLDPSKYGEIQAMVTAKLSDLK